MRCGRCGAEYDASDNFCRNCGKPIVRLGAPGESAQAVAPEYAALSSRDRKRIRRARTWSAAVVIVALSALLLAELAPDILKGISLAPKDLGVKWTDADYQSILAKTNVQTDVPPAGTDRGKYSDVFSGQQSVDWTLTQSEITAWLNDAPHPGYWPFHDMQVKISSGNLVEASMSLDPMKILTWPEVTDHLPPEIVSFLKHLPMDIPLYVRGEVQFTGPRQVQVHLQQAVAEGFSLPGFDEANQILEDVINGVLGKIDQINIAGFSTDDGSLALKGSWYQQQKRMPAK